ncbi:hypothetical protein B4Q13_17825 [Lacticaseibacillus rhamnosus]
MDFLRGFASETPCHSQGSMSRQVIRLHPAAPVKPPETAPCNGCGVCCTACTIASMVCEATFQLVWFWCMAATEQPPSSAATAELLVAHSCSYNKTLVLEVTIALSSSHMVNI